jgi:lactaldehyde reductase
MSTNRIILNETSYFGPGSRAVLADEIKKRGFKKVFVVTDNDLVKFGVAAQVTSVLEAAGIPFEIFSDVKQNPTVKQVKAGGEKFAASGADVIVAIGGGSPIDTSKAIGIIANNPEFADVVSLEGVADTKKKSVPIIALPTTAGTAAEVTINYVITDEENVKKMVCVDPNDIPVMAIVDAELMLSMPKGLTAATGMDALTHAIEGYITKGAWTMSDMFELIFLGNAIPYSTYVLQQQ